MTDVIVSLKINSRLLCVCFFCHWKIDNRRPPTHTLLLLREFFGGVRGEPDGAPTPVTVTVATAGHASVGVDELVAPRTPRPEPDWAVALETPVVVEQGIRPVCDKLTVSPVGKT